MANGIRCSDKLASVTGVHLVAAVQIGVVLLAMGCRTPWSGLVARSGGQGIVIEELATDSSEPADESLRVTSPRSQQKSRPSRYGETVESKPKSELADIGQLEESNDEPAWVTEGLNAAPAPQRDLLRKQVQATLKAREARQQSGQPPASKHFGDADESSTSVPPIASSEPSGSFKLSDRSAETETHVRTNTDKTAEDGVNIARVGATEPEKAAKKNLLPIDASSRKNLSSIPQEKIHLLPASADSPADTIVRMASSAAKDGSKHQQVKLAHGESSPAEFVGVETEPRDAVNELDWRGHLREALKDLDNDRGSSTLSPEQQLHHDAIKRMIGLSLGDLDSAMEPIDGMQPHVQDFFRYQFQALHDAIDPNGNPVLSRRWTLALQNARKALGHLSEVSNLEVQNLTFCSEVESFGVTTKFPQYHFRPEQELLLYCELDNFVAEQVKDGFETKLQGSYEIVDSTGRRTADQLLQLDQHVCRNQRRDYFIAYRIFMPREIAQGRYQLKLTIEDMKGRKFGQSTIDFQIVQ